MTNFVIVQVLSEKKDDFLSELVYRTLGCAGRSGKFALWVYAENFMITTCYSAMTIGRTFVRINVNDNIEIIDRIGLSDQEAIELALRWEQKLHSCDAL